MTIRMEVNDMRDNYALEALEEVRDQLNASVSTELLRELLQIEQLHAFDERHDISLRAIEAVIDNHLSVGANP
jgi:hypothetical protein